MTELWEELSRTCLDTPGTREHAWRAVADRARELLTKPVATREAVDAELRKFLNVRPTLTELDGAMHILQHFAAPDRPKMMIEGMTEGEIANAMREERNRHGLQYRWDHDDAARVAHRLANTPAQTVDEDSGPREMCDTWANTQNAKPGPLRDSVPTFDDGNDEWKARWRQHYAWVLSGFPKEPEWARSREGGGR